MMSNVSQDQDCDNASDVLTTSSEDLLSGATAFQHVRTRPAMRAPAHAPPMAVQTRPSRPATRAPQQTHRPRERSNSVTHDGMLLDTAPQQGLFVDSSLRKLFQSMTLANKAKLTSPTWNNFKGLSSAQKIRLSNVIRRAWHMDYVCAVIEPVRPVNASNEVDNSVQLVAGKYWKRRLSIVSEYRRWRLWYKDRISGVRTRSDSMAASAVSDPHSGSMVMQPCFEESIVLDDVPLPDLTDALLPRLGPQHSAFPDPREIDHAGCAEIIPAGLLPLLSLLDDIKATLEMCTEYFTRKNEASSGCSSTGQVGMDSSQEFISLDYSGDSDAYRKHSLALPLSSPAFDRSTTNSYRTQSAAGASSVYMSDSPPYAPPPPTTTQHSGDTLDAMLSPDTFRPVQLYQPSDLSELALRGEDIQHSSTLSPTPGGDPLIQPNVLAAAPDTFGRSISASSGSVVQPGCAAPTGMQTRSTSAQPISKDCGKKAAAETAAMGNVRSTSGEVNSPVRTPLSVTLPSSNEGLTLAPLPTSGPVLPDGVVQPPLGLPTKTKLPPKSPASELNIRTGAPTLTSVVLPAEIVREPLFVPPSANTHDPAARSSEQSASPASPATSPTPSTGKLMEGSLHDLEWPPAIDLEWPHPDMAVGCGLTNPSKTTCFINATLQCLAHTAPLYNYFVKNNHHCHIKGSGFCLTCKLQELLLSVLRASPMDALEPKVIIENLSLFAEEHSDGRQHDAHQFLHFVMNAMVLAASGHQDPDTVDGVETTMPGWIFHGVSQSSVHCKGCKHTFDTLELFWDIQLAIGETVNHLEDALHIHTQREELTSPDNLYYCELCGKLTRSTKQLTIQVPPNILTVLFKRYLDTGMSLSKVDKAVAFPERLNLRPFMSDPNDASDVIYQLYAVLVHRGASLDSGHYFSYVTIDGKSWFCCNDAEVSPADKRTVLKQKAYMLFYVRTPCDPENSHIPMSTPVRPPDGAQLVSGQSPSGPHLESPASDSELPQTVHSPPLAQVQPLSLSSPLSSESEDSFAALLREMNLFCVDPDANRFKKHLFRKGSLMSPITGSSGTTPSASQSPATEEADGVVTIELRDGSGSKRTIPSGTGQSTQVMTTSPVSPQLECRVSQQMSPFSAQQPTDNEEIVMHLSRACHRDLRGSDGKYLHRVHEKTGISVKLPTSPDSDAVTLYGNPLGFGEALDLLAQQIPAIHVVHVQLRAPGSIHSWLAGSDSDGLKAMLARLCRGVEVQFFPEKDLVVVTGAPACLKVRKLCAGCVREHNTVDDLVDIPHRSPAPRAEEIQQIQETGNVSMAEEKEVVLLGSQDAMDVAKPNIIHPGEVPVMDVSEKVDVGIKFPEGMDNRAADANCEQLAPTVGPASEVPKQASVTGRPEDREAIPNPAHQSDVIGIGGQRRNVDEANEKLAARVKELERLEKQRAGHNYPAGVRVDITHHLQISGQHGGNVRKLRNEFQVEIQFPQDAAASADADKTVTSGLESQAPAARDKGQARTESEKRKSRVEVPLDSRTHARIMDDNGRTLTDLDNRFQVKINFPGRDDEKASGVTVAGETEKVNNCEAEMMRMEGIGENGQDASFQLGDVVENETSRAYHAPAPAAQRQVDCENGSATVGEFMVKSAPCEQIVEEFSTLNRQTSSDNCIPAAIPNSKQSAPTEETSGKAPAELDPGSPKECETAKQELLLGERGKGDAGVSRKKMEARGVKKIDDAEVSSVHAVQPGRETVAPVSQRKGDVLRLDGYEYLRDFSRKDGKHFWRCRRTTDCMVKLNMGGRVPILDREHWHDRLEQNAQAPEHSEPAAQSEESPTPATVVETKEEDAQQTREKPGKTANAPRERDQRGRFTKKKPEGK
ncbi:uncharacterized protein LOC129591803 isoform X2 [Paramacrobiotus metropolitanus]|uniref:uncharacterized protein LOC129591803 isoform X2 n=1 Tax=Paramacrobiotus metropolitanus TaxID=2943436 RepID=UPI002445F3E5|nr:uncharacterized protein LOC129591803 isoform X2 [Paramacrobiotus metropolitanus]